MMKTPAKLVYLGEAPLRLTTINVRVPFEDGVLILLKSEMSEGTFVEEEIENIHVFGVRISKITDTTYEVVGRCRFSHMRHVVGRDWEVDVTDIPEQRTRATREQLLALADVECPESEILNLMQQVADSKLHGKERWRYFLSTEDRLKFLTKTGRSRFDREDPGKLLKGLPPEAQEEVDNQLKRLSIVNGKEKEVLLDWFNWMSRLPWKPKKEKEVSIQDLKEEMERTHYGLQDVKKTILTQMAFNKMRGEDQGNVLCFLGPPSTGKAQPLDAKVLTPDGWQEIGKLSVGSIISSPSKPFTTVTGVFPQGELDIYEVRFSDGTTTRCCMEHLWTVRSPSGQKATLSLKEIQSSKTKWNFPLLKPSGEHVQEAYLDTNLSEDDLSKDESWRISKLRGLMDRSGKLRRYSNWIKGPPLIKQLVRSLGGTAIPSGGGYIITTSFNPFRKYESRWGGEEPRKYILSIEPCGKQEAVCIAVSAKDQLYITDDYIITHNTTIAGAIGKALGREVVKVSLGSVRDEAVIRGHRRAYIGAGPGRIITALAKCKNSNPIMILDEIDKCSDEMTGVLLELLDPEQNSQFVDQYLEVPVDLSRVIFICTANYGEQLPPPLKNRMQVIRFKNFTQEELRAITEQFIIPDLSVPCVEFSEEVVERLSRLKTTRKIKQQVRALVGQGCLEHLQTGEETIEITGRHWPEEPEDNRIGFG